MDTKDHMVGWDLLPYGDGEMQCSGTGGIRMVYVGRGEGHKICEEGRERNDDLDWPYGSARECTEGEGSKGTKGDKRWKMEDDR